MTPAASGRHAPRREFILHLGMTKTGTTSLQEFCRINRDALEAAGLLHPPGLGGARHVVMSLLHVPPAELPQHKFWQERFGPPEEFRARCRRALADAVAESDADRVLLTDENLQFLRRPGQRAVRRFIAPHAASTRVVTYLRRQDNHLISGYQQNVKLGMVARLTEFAARPHRRRYDYFTQLSQWQRAIKPAAMVVRTYESHRFKEGSLYADFLDACGVDTPMDTLQVPKQRNTTLDAEAVEFLRILNLHQVEHRGARVKRIPNGRWVKGLRELPRGPRLSLPPAELDAFMGRWEETNRRTAQEILRRPDGELFTEPRTAGDVVTDQRLDPLRVDHFLEAAGVPESWHADLRRIAEREA